MMNTEITRELDDIKRRLLALEGRPQPSDPTEPPEEQRRTEPDWRDEERYVWDVVQGCDERWRLNLATNLAFPTEEQTYRVLRAIAEASNWTPVCPPGFATVWVLDGRHYAVRPKGTQHGVYVKGNPAGGWIQSPIADTGTREECQGRLDKLGERHLWTVAYYFRLEG